MELMHLKKKPQIAPSAYIVNNATVIGDVEIGDDSSVWFNAVIRGDVNYIKIGKRTNIQDGSLLHVTKDKYPLILEDDITVGHGVILHGCVIRSMCIIGMGAVILDNVEIGEGCVIAAGSVVKEGTKVPPYTMLAGIPATPKKKVTDDDIERIKKSAQHYIEYKNVYKGI